MNGCVLVFKRRFSPITFAASSRFEASISLSRTKSADHKSAHFNGARRIENARCHDAAVFGEDEGRITPPAASGVEVGICDLKRLFSAGVKGNMKSSGKRSALRFTSR